MTTASDHFGRRHDDSGMGKLWAYLKTAIPYVVIFGTFFFWLGSTKWESKDEAIACHDKMQTQITTQDKTQAVMLNELKNISESVARIEDKLK
jgi:hypothetical protein